MEEGWYWYFEFEVTDANGYHKHDYSLVSSADWGFPISSILDWKDEVFGEDAEFRLTYTVQISYAEYDAMLPRIDPEI